MGKLASGISKGLLATCLLWPLPQALAAEAPDSGRILQEQERTERKLPERHKAPVEVLEPTKPPMPQDSGLTVFVKGFQITGQNAHDTAALEAMLAPYANKNLTFAQLNEAADKVAKHFRSHGWFLAQAYLPVQDITSGTIEIAVMVGRFGDVIVKNSSGLATWVIRRELSSITGGAYVHNDVVERAALLATDLAGLDAKLTLAPGKRTGLVDVVVEAKRKAKLLTGSLAENNWGNRYTGQYQTTLDVTLANPLHIGDSFGFDATYAGKGQATGGVRWKVPVGEGQKLNFGYSRVQYLVGEDLGYLDSYGWADTWHGDWTYSLKRSRDRNLSVQLGFDHRNLQDFMSTAGTTTVKSSNSGFISLFGDRVDNFGGGGATSYGVTWRRGNLSGSSDTADLATGNWEKYSYYIMRQQTVTQRLSMFLSLSGQFANTNLDSSERFSLGGANGVRAYPSGEASGDEAWLFTAEMRWAIPVKGKTVLQLIGFFDAGVSFIEKSQTMVGDNRRSISGYGIGAQWTRPGDWSLKAHYAWKSSAEAARSDIDRNGRLWVQAVKYF